MKDLTTLAVLSDLDLPKWEPTKVDRQTNREIMETKHAAEKRGRFTKRLMAEVSPLTYIQRKMYMEHERLTTPWKKGWRLLPVENIEELEKFERQCVQELEDALEAMRPNYDEYINVTNRRELGDLWDPNDYLPFDQFKQCWGIKLDYIPVPDSGHFVVDVQQKILDSIRDRFTDNSKEKYDAIVKGLWKKLYDVTKPLARRLSDENMRFRDREVMDPLRELVNMLPTLNVTNDPELEEMVKQMREYVNVRDEDLRKDDVKTKAAHDVKKLLDKMADYVV